MADTLKKRMEPKDGAPGVLFRFHPQPFWFGFLSGALWSQQKPFCHKEFRLDHCSLCQQWFLKTLMVNNVIVVVAVVVREAFVGISVLCAIGCQTSE